MLVLTERLFGIVHIQGYPPLKCSAWNISNLIADEDTIAKNWIVGDRKDGS